MNWSEAKILFKYPSRFRPQKFFEGLNSIVDNLNQPKNCVVVCSFDEDDEKMNLPFVQDNLMGYNVELIIHRGRSKNKIHACNRDMNHLHDAQIFILMSDDMRFIQKGFDDTIRQAFATHFPDGDGVLHFNDGNQKANCLTMCIHDRKYHDRFHYFYHKDYESVECDVEYQEVAKMLGRYVYMGDEVRIIDHLHPSFGKSSYDEQYNRTENWDVHNRDKITRARRKANNYDLININGAWETMKPKVFMSFPNQQPMSEPVSVEVNLSTLAENIKQTTKKREKLMEKIEDCKSLAKEISDLGILKVEVSVTEESLK